MQNSLLPSLLLPARIPTLLSALLSLLPAAAAQAASEMPSFESVRRDFRSSDIRVLDRNGELLERLRIDSKLRRGDWIALGDISPALREAMLMSEDRRFYEHSGVDWRAVGAAAWGNLWNTRTRGASTITMQLAGLQDDELKRACGGRSLAQKFSQTLAAQELERSWRKDQILEAYLNSVPFRGELVGIDALSRTLFGKAPQGLDVRESAVAAALVRAPNARPAAVAQRACELMRAMAPDQTADCAAIDMFASAALQRRGFDASEGIAPHFARRVLKETQADGRPADPAAVRAAAPGAGAGSTLATTLSAPLQRFALASLERHLRELRGRHVEDGALVVLDNASGEVLAWVGSSGSLSRAAEVDGVLAQRQPGSALKPFLYAEAIAEKRLTAASLLDDSPAQISTAGGLYIPQNYDHQFKGYVSVRTALASSLNVPAVRTLVMVSPESFARTLRAAGIALPQTGDYYGYSLALGSAEVSLLALTNGYRTLANGGRYGTTRDLSPAPAGAPASRQGIRGGSAVIDPRAAFIVGDILSDANARARTFGLDSVLGTRFWSAVKTGTSKDMRDNWALGWSERYTVGVWVGNASGAPMWDVSGTSGAAPVWAEVMGYLHRRQPSRPPAAPAGVLRAQVRFGDGLEAARAEWFIDGTAQPLFALANGVPAGAAPRVASEVNQAANRATNAPSASQANAEVAARISAPADGTILALDPDIPPEHQRVRFEATGGRGLQWRIDGKPFVRGASAQWLPWPGRHSVELLDTSGQVVDQIRLEVRGAGVVAARR